MEIYKENEDKFEKDYGIKQIVNAIWLLNESKEIFPIELNEKHKYSVYPVVILNERLFQGPFSNLFFQRLMIESIKNKFNIELDISKLQNTLIVGKLTIYPIVVMHIQDVEALQSIISKKEDIFYLIQKYRRNRLKISASFHEVMLKERIARNHHVQTEKAKNLFYEFIDKKK